MNSKNGSGHFTRFLFLLEWVLGGDVLRDTLLGGLSEVSLRAILSRLSWWWVVVGGDEVPYNPERVLRETVKSLITTPTTHQASLGRESS